MANMLNARGYIQKLPQRATPNSVSIHIWEAPGRHLGRRLGTSGGQRRLGGDRKRKVDRRLQRFANIGARPTIWPQRGEPDPHHLRSLRTNAGERPGAIGLGTTMDILT